MNFIIDALALLVMLAMVGTGLVIRYVLPPGSGGRGSGPGLSLWRLSRHDWGDMHFWLAIVLVGLFVVHVALHWNWVCVTARRWACPKAEPMDKTSGWMRNLWGLVFFVVLVLLTGLFIWWGWAHVNSTLSDGEAGRPHYRGGRGTTSAPFFDEHPRGGGRKEYGGQRFRGSMTLREVADDAGVSVDRIKELLSLPGDTPQEERLGQLGRKQGFDLNTVRTLLEQLGDEKAEVNVRERER